MRFASFDLFRKVPRDLTKSTSTGAIFSVLALATMALLVVLEFTSYLRGRVDTAVIIDDNKEASISVSFKVTLMEIPCQFASVDVYDYLGQTRLDVHESIYKTRISGNQQHLGAYIPSSNSIQHDAEDAHDPSLVVSQELVEGTFPSVLESRGEKYTFVNFFANWCVHCQRLAPTWEAFAKAVRDSGIDVAVYRVDCVHHEPLCRDQSIMGYPTLRLFTAGMPLKDDYHGHRTVDALMQYIERESGQHQRPDVEQHNAAAAATPAASSTNREMRLSPREGCTISGQLSVHRVPGSIRFHAKSASHDFEPRNTNVSHSIHHLSFGHPVRNALLRRVPRHLVPALAPLDGRAFVNPAPAGFLSHDHYVKVVSTHYKMGGWTGTGAREVTGYQMTVSSHMYAHADDAVPEVKLSYDLSPTAILITDRGAKRWYEFLTSLCAIVGGAFTVIGLMDSAVHATIKRTAKASQRKLM